VIFAAGKEFLVEVLEVDFLVENVPNFWPDLFLKQLLKKALVELQLVVFKDPLKNFWLLSPLPVSAFAAVPPSF